MKNLQRKREGKYILGVNINTNSPADNERAAADLAGLYEAFGQYADYYTVNWGSMTPEVLAGALTALDVHKQRLNKPVLLKLPADVPVENWMALLNLPKYITWMGLLPRDQLRTVRC